MASIRQRGTDSYQITVCAGYDGNNKKITKMKTVKRTEGFTDKKWQKELDKLAMEFEREVEKGLVLDGSKLTFAEFCEKWLEKYAERELEPKTLYGYKEMLKLRILPALGHIRLDKIQPHHLIDFYDNLKESGIRLDTKYKARTEILSIIKDKGLTYNALAKLSGISENTVASMLKFNTISSKSAGSVSKALNEKLEQIFEAKDENNTLSSRTVLHHHRLISAILTTAVQWQLIMSNPALRVKAPKADRAEICYYNLEQTKALLEALDKEELKYKTMVLLDVFTGLRIGELMGLSWDNIDFDNSTIDIKKVSQHISGMGTFEKSKPKNETSIRKITIPAPIMALLKEYRIKWLEQKLNCGDLWQNSDRLFVTWDGKPLYTYTLTDWFPGFLQKHNLPKITPHGLRHTSATLLAAQGLEVAAISKRLGHGRISTTMDIYMHALKSADTIASNLLEKALL